MNKEARQAFLQFAESPDTPWRGNFRDLNAAVTRMATLAPRSRIRVEEVTEEIARLRESWQRPGTAAPEEAVDLATVLDEAALAELDPFVARTAAESGPCLGAANRFGASLPQSWRNFTLKIFN